MSATENAAVLEQSTKHGIVAGRYSLEAQIGSGGVGVVHRARDDASGRVIAFKQLLSSRAGSRRKIVETLFEREYHTLVRLKHPRIIEVYDYGFTEDGPYYTMELLGGADLSQLGRLPYRDVCRHLRDVASSLALLHAHRLIHRDVSSRNVRLTAAGEAKLLDFGALASFGTATEVVGTPVHMAPEVLRQMPLDHRTDLFSLGSVGYFALTGRHPYPVRRLAELSRAWETAPAPPSTLVPGIPPDLDRLILSLLDLDPLGRPASAALVMDRLTVVGQLPPEAHEHAAESYFLSSQMVGRSTEVDWVAKRVERALEGKGGEVIVEGASGVGKTRLLNEICLAAQLKGVVVLKADAELAPSNFGVAATIAVNFIRSCPDLARQTIGPHGGLLGHLSPELAKELGVDAGALPLDPGERRARLQTGLHEWFLAALRECTLILAVDNVHAADDNSGAFLAALGREARTSRLLVLATQRDRNAVVAETPLRLIRERSSRLKLAGLDAKACEALASSLFGSVTNAGRMGRLLYERSGGVPQQCMDLAQLMAERKIAKYVAGTWVLPLDVGRDELPSRVEEILSVRLSGLGASAIGLLELLSIHPRPVPIDLIRALAEGESESETYAALGHLVAEQILASEATTYRFRQESVREAVLSRMDAGRRRASHLKAAETLLASAGSGVGLRIEAALHLLEAGEERRSAAILVTAAREFVASSGTHDSPDEAARALHRMVRIYERQGRSEHEIGALLFPLMPLAYYSAHWRYVLEYGEQAIDIGLRITGLSRAAELEPTLGREAALGAGLRAGGAGFAEHGEDLLGYDLKAAIASSCAMVPAIVGTCGTCLDTERVKRIANLVAPLKLFGESHVAALMHEFAVADVLTVQGRESEARAPWEHSLAGYAHPNSVQALGVGHSKSLQGGVLFTLGILDAYTFGRRALETAERMEALGVRTWAMAADQVRLLYHSFRGESERVQHYRDRVELFAVQGSTTWQAEMFWPALLLNADVLTSDTIAARRTSEQLARRAKDVAVLGPYADAAHAAYLMLRGDLSASLVVYERVLADFPIRDRVGWETTRAYYARALNAAGEHDLARRVALEVISNMVPTDYDCVVHFLEPQRQLALAEAGLENHAEAARILDELLGRHGHEDNALLVGLLHQARAQVAVLAGDATAFERHSAEMETRFRSTKNPALFAQCQRQSEPQEPAARAAQISIGDSAARTHKEGGFRTVDELSVAADPCEAALQIVMDKSKAKSGFLYIVRDDGLQLTAASHPNEPPMGLETELRQKVDVARRDLSRPESEAPTPGVRAALAELERRSLSPDVAGGDAENAGTSTVFVDSIPPPDDEGPYRLILLRAGDGAARFIVGGFILEADPQNVSCVAPDLLESVARVLYERRHETSPYATV